MTRGEPVKLLRKESSAWSKYYASSHISDLLPIQICVLTHTLSHVHATRFTHLILHVRDAINLLHGVSVMLPHISLTFFLFRYVC